MTARLYWTLLGTVLAAVSGCQGVPRSGPARMPPPPMLGQRPVETGPITSEPPHQVVIHEAPSPVPDLAVADSHPTATDPAPIFPQAPADVISAQHVLPPDRAAPPAIETPGTLIPPAVPGELPLTAQRIQTFKREPLVEAITCILDNRANEALEHLKTYDRPTQELFLRLLPPLATLHQKGVDKLSPIEVAVLHEQLQGLIATLRPRTELLISKMCFCEWVKAFGVYQPLAEGHAFLASDGHRPGEQVQVYVELQNFACEARETYHETRLASTVEVFDARGNRVWGFQERNQPLRSRTLLHDYFNIICFCVPPDIAPGVYNLVVHVTDETRPEGKREAVKSLEFRVRR